MAKKLLSLIIIPLALAFFLTGCWDSLAINKRTIVTAVLLDKQEDEFIFYLEIANTDNSNENGGSEGAPKYRILKATGSTVPKAREALERQLDKPIYLSSIRTLILTPNITGDDLVAYFNRLREDVHYRKMVTIVITEDDPEELFKTINDIGQSVGFYIEDLLIDIENAGQTFMRPTMRLIENISNVYSAFLIHQIGLTDPALELKGYSLVGGKDFVGFIPKEECHGLIYLKNPNTKWAYILDYEGTEYSILAKLKNRKVSPNYNDGKISFDLEFKIEGEHLYYNKVDPSLASPETLTKLEELLKDKIKHEIEEIIEIAQFEYNWDFLSFDDEFYTKYPAIYRKLDWHNEFQKVKTNVVVETEISSKKLMDYHHEAVE